MTLYLSQKALFCLFASGFLIGLLATVIYTASDVILWRYPKRRIFRLLWHTVRGGRDICLFALIGAADAIALFVFYSGRLRVSLFLWNILGYLLCETLLMRPCKRLARRLFTKK